MDAWMRVRGKVCPNLIRKKTSTPLIAFFRIFQINSRTLSSHLKQANHRFDQSKNLKKFFKFYSILSINLEKRFTGHSLVPRKKKEQETTIKSTYISTIITAKIQDEPNWTG